MSAKPMEPTVHGDGGDTTETDSDREYSGHHELVYDQHALKRESRASVAAAHAATPSTETKVIAEVLDASPHTTAAPSTRLRSGASARSTAPAIRDPAIAQPARKKRASPSAAVTTAAMSRVDEDRCPLCLQKYVPVRSKDTDGAPLTCACCQRAGLTKRDFSKSQQLRDDRERRCKTCTQSEMNLLEILRKHSRTKSGAVVSLDVMIKKRQAAEKRWAKKKEEKPAAEVVVIEVDASSAAESSEDEELVERRVEKAVRDILTANRSIHRRREVIDLDGPYREAYQLELLEEETKLHEQAVALCLKNTAIYDRVCDKVLVVDGKVKLGERDHEQGEFDGDKPNHRITKSGKTRIIRKQPISSTYAIELDKALLRGAKSTAENRRQARPVSDADEPPRKKLRYLNTDGIEMAVLNRPRRSAAKPATYVMDGDF